MTPQEVYNLFRTDVSDAVAPFLWTEDEVWGYLRDAERMLVRLTGGIRDASSAACTLAITTAEPFAALHPSILSVRNARLPSIGRTLPVYSFEELFQPHAEPRSISTADLDQSGDVRALIIGMEKGKLRVVRTPIADDTVQLVVERLPLANPRDSADDETGLEVDDQHRLHLLRWMKSLAYLKQDADTYDKARSDEERALFLAYAEQCQQEKSRANNKPRLMAYGGIGGHAGGRLARGGW